MEHVDARRYEVIASGRTGDARRVDLYNDGVVSVAGEGRRKIGVAGGFVVLAEATLYNADEILSFAECVRAGGKQTKLTTLDYARRMWRRRHERAIIRAAARAR